MSFVNSSSLPYHIGCYHNTKKPLLDKYTINTHAGEGTLGQTETGGGGDKHP